MKQSLGIGIVVCLGLVAVTALAQQKKGKLDAVTTTTDTIVKGAPVRVVPVRMDTVTLGRSSLTGGGVSKRLFDSLMRQGVRPSKPALKVKGFAVSYMERSWFETESGEIKPMIDMSTEYCFGDTLSRTLKALLYDHTKKGDTVFIDNIKIAWPDGVNGRGSSMKFWINSNN